MKSALFIIALLFIGYQSFSQAVVATVGKDTTVLAGKLPSGKEVGHYPDTTAKAVDSSMYAIILTGPELVNMFQFIANGDIYSDKGKAQFLEALKQKIRVIPKK